MDPRFGLIPLPLSDAAKAAINELMVDYTSGHIYLKANGRNISKTFELEQRLTEMENRLKSYQSHITLTGSLLYNSLILPTGVTATLSGSTVRLTGATSLTNAQIRFNKSYCSFFYSTLESYFMSIDLDGKVKKATMISDNNKEFDSDMAANHKTKTNQKVSSIIYCKDDSTISQVEPVIYLDFSAGAVTLRSIVINRIDTNIYNAIGLGDSIHIDYRYADSHLLEKAGVVSGKSTSISCDCFKIYKENSVNKGYLKIYLPNNIIKPGRYALQIILKSTTATSMLVNLNPQVGNSNFNVNTSKYPADVDGRKYINLSFNWDNYKADDTSDKPYLLITSGNTEVILVESVHIVRAYSASFSDNNLWKI